VCRILAQEEEPWWKATDEDNFDVNQKLRRLGCRPLKRKYLACKQKERLFEKTVGCDDLKDELEKCVKIVQYLHSSYSVSASKNSSG
jgi:hypothetical protein